VSTKNPDGVRRRAGGGVPALRGVSGLDVGEDVGQGPPLGTPPMDAAGGVVAGGRQRRAGVCRHLPVVSLLELLRSSSDMPASPTSRSASIAVLTGGSGMRTRNAQAPSRRCRVAGLVEEAPFP
jgi:hypothetical protein